MRTPRYLSVQLTIISLVAPVVVGIAPSPSIVQALGGPARTTIAEHPSVGDPWLDDINWWRSFGGSIDGRAFPTVTTQPGDELGPRHQVEYLTDIAARGSSYCGHDQDPALPKPAGVDYFHDVLFCGPTTLTTAVDGWINTPYHAPPLLSPQTVRVGAAHGSLGPLHVSAAVRSATAPISTTYVWPAPGGSMPRERMMIGETPNPSSLCPSVAGGAMGQTAFVWFPSDRVYVSSKVTDAGGLVPSCALADPYARVPLANGSGVSMVAVLPRRPLLVAGRTAVELVTTAPDGGDRQVLSWDFQVLSVPAQVTATLTGLENSASVTIPALTPTQEGGTPILQRQLQLWSKSARLEGDPTYRVDVPGSGPGSTVVQTPGGEFWACVSVRNAVGWSPCMSFVGVSIVLVPFVGAQASAGFQPVDPVRLLDTREPGAIFGRLSPYITQVIDLRGRVPAGARAIAVNLAAVDTAAPGWVRIYPCSSTVPATSDLNPTPGIVTTNAAVVKIGDGRLCVQSLTATDLVIDLNGWLTTTSTAGLAVGAPRRVLDTRIVGQASGRLSGGMVAEVPVVAAGSTTVAVSLNVTAVDPGENGYVTAWPCGSPRPFVANLNPSAGITRPNLVNVRVGTGGKVCIYSLGATDIVVDLMGEYRPGASARYAAVDSIRIMDTRDLDPQRAADGASLVPSGTVVAVQGNLTAVSPTQSGFLSSYACTSQPWPGTANVNVLRGETVGNAVLMSSSGGMTCVRDTSGAEFVVDATGVWKSG